LVLTDQTANADMPSDQRAASPPAAPAVYVPTIDSAAEGEVSLQSLTTDFFTANAKSVQGIIQKGRIIKLAEVRLKEPKDQWKHAWKAWVKGDLKLSEWGAALYMHISEHHILSDPQFWKFLPVDYRTLYELSLIPDEKLLESINKGGVHHDLSPEYLAAFAFEERINQDSSP
jgi:hypothetical protein